MPCLIFENFLKLWKIKWAFPRKNTPLSLSFFSHTTHTQTHTLTCSWKLQPMPMEIKLNLEQLKRILYDLKLMVLSSWFCDYWILLGYYRHKFKENRIFPWVCSNVNSQPHLSEGKILVYVLLSGSCTLMCMQLFLSYIILKSYVFLRKIGQHA